ncbi:MAG: hypothetical protein ABS81_07425 [Pseudonocardia sp. SCN 72-86]|nr:MAG: hypothetical protein ABS81_07425 [Pseudonocardia sp. SCN 72-86]
MWSEHGARIDSAAELTARGGAAYWPDEWPDGELDGAWCWRGTPDGDERVPIEDHFPHGAPWPRDGQRRTA